MGNEFTTVIQVSKQFLSSEEIKQSQESSLMKDQQYQNYVSKKQEVMRFLRFLIIRLKFPIRVLQVTSYLFQRFFLFNSFRKYSSYSHEIAVTCLFLSIKMNDCIRKSRDLILVAHDIRLSPPLNSDEVVKDESDLTHILAENKVDEQRKKVLYFERLILECIAFDFRHNNIEDYLIKFSKTLSLHPQVGYISWLVSVDAMMTEVILKQSPHVIALSSIVLAKLLYPEIFTDKMVITELDSLDLKYSRFQCERSQIYESVNEMMEFYMSKNQLANSFLFDFLPKDLKFNDLVINLKLELPNHFDIPPNKRKAEATINKDDLFYKERDYEIGKAGTILFVYNND
ncbi:CTD kinase subunit beta [Komagataella phaffii CBS 7435]|uniref:CTD kinase subunit beta n=1 Tax=Komagataella phaffii (strain ATCC 76273 / CBS 7435 / CECT 11047 / NRRL Y-11430 / Wegner 21-1) TaxID=981350 RepID=F2QYB7_KOMPC|nr:GQ67_05123T0 [Komagataella phaffii]AOA69609.1 GQ68_05105T0 [Komagataella phaffii GS115]CAH2450593.1 CTD kinase subunit beta [Komagataella phaffii CBS 7435]CCA40395.2 CTD kinase subunit beta [Komagataella phaffii CBS 7435]